ncbi:MAG: tRNA (guanosine(37)-N1)-methyltransferase TrmD [Chloroflexi bacterium]|nr:tRNA (guanosine(37)-N1)-methyltransferase TrmD [Chloroflexota bacterium]MBM3154492.1 tRNA (guanosine(37)-N1)-methyltransferase TrmD [Chloroflexota bacterium]MBM3172278.1 tRNA (guanosine(37)-N1)-methyltransferase TrmD [Chloroflexota bacterium]MBM3174750.1 tRNA (guanosine(37)-N1)-methyltransferase TrmD [Chloroflexota bacterium]MBM4449841.1 tRNA (guanosine(37)-N1)-methyltransferase TrmD [Chloroflexota bacterium]
MRIDILTLFPDVFGGFFAHSIVGRAVAKGVVDIRLHNVRTFTHDKHHVVDDYPYGGGAGMVLKPEPVFEAVEFVKQDAVLPSVHTVLLSPQGRLLNQSVVRELSGYEQLVLICGHYEGIDERVAMYLANDEVSIGDYVLSGGEVAAMVVVDCVVRLLPGVVGSEVSLVEESYNDGFLEYPQYTRPAVYRGLEVPSILLSGDHKQVARWRRQQSLMRTAKRRSDLMAKAVLSDEDKKLLSDALQNQVTEGI